MNCNVYQGKIHSSFAYPEASFSCKQSCTSIKPLNSSSESGLPQTLKVNDLLFNYSLDYLERKVSHNLFSFFGRYLLKASYYVVLTYQYSKNLSYEKINTFFRIKRLSICAFHGLNGILYAHQSYFF